MTFTDIKAKFLVALHKASTPHKVEPRNVSVLLTDTDTVRVVVSLDHYDFAHIFPDAEWTEDPRPSGWVYAKGTRDGIEYTCTRPGGVRA